MPNILLAGVIMAVGFWMTRLLKRVAHRLVQRISHHEALTNLLISVFQILLLSMFFFTALSVLQLDKAVTSILAGAGIIGLALAFAFQDIASNFMSGSSSSCGSLWKWAIP